MDLLRTDNKPTPSVTIKGREPNSHIESRRNAAQNTGKTQETEATTESSRRSAEKQVKIDLTQDTGPKGKSNDMQQEWDSFNKKLQDTTKKTDVQETIRYLTPHQTQKVSEFEKMDEQGTSSQNAEIIPTFLTSDIILKVTEIHPLDVFYSPLHKVVVRRQRKRRRVKTLEFPPRNEPMDIV